VLGAGFAGGFAAASAGSRVGFDTATVVELTGLGAAAATERAGSGERSGSSEPAGADEGAGAGELTGAEATGAGVGLGRADR
jgi:hypothetical protein